MMKKVARFDNITDWGLEQFVNSLQRQKDKEGRHLPLRLRCAAQSCLPQKI